MFGWSYLVIIVLVINSLNEGAVVTVPGEGRYHGVRGTFYSAMNYNVCTKFILLIKF